MGENDRIILQSLFDDYKREGQENFSDDQHFELFAFDQILKNYELSYEEIIEGDINGGNDGGIDGFFTFLNGDLFDEGTDFEKVKKNPVVDFYLIQVKNNDSFSETAMDRLIVTSSDVFDLSKDEAYIRGVYNPALSGKIMEFKKFYLNIGKRHPLLKVHFVYATRGLTKNIHANVKVKADRLIQTVSQHFGGAEASVEFLGARELLDACRRQKSYTLELTLAENVLSRAGANYVGLSSLEDYFKFITDKEGNLLRYIFESDVRDFQGSNVQVNKDILKTLSSDNAFDFWWFNNGITILVSKATISGKVMTLDNVQIVNGLQTSFCIYDYFKNKNIIEGRDKERTILLRVIVMEDSATQDKIIKATNSQTAIPPSSLRATDKIQRDIEDFFMHHDWYYDRRKNYYKNIGKQQKRIVSIPYLAQAVMAILSREPNSARARPASLVKNDTDYDRVFNESLDFGVYLFCAKLLKRLDAYIWGEFDKHTITERTNLKFHVAMVVVIKLMGSTKYSPKDLLTKNVEDITDDLLDQSLDETIAIGKDYAKDQEWSIERLAKNKGFVEYLISNIKTS